MLRFIARKVVRGIVTLVVIYAGLIVGTIIGDLTQKDYDHGPDWSAINQVELDKDAEVLAQFITAKGG